MGRGGRGRREVGRAEQRDAPPAVLARAHRARAHGAHAADGTNCAATADVAAVPGKVNGLVSIARYEKVFRVWRQELNLLNDTIG